MSPVESVPRIALITVIVCATAVVAAPYQELAPRKGYVPVYIRVGDTLLSEIHPKLAEAFGELESANLQLEANAHPASEGSAQVEHTDSRSPSTTDKREDLGPRVSAAGKEEEVPAVVVEAANPTKESDIASFDVVKGEDRETAADSAQTETKKQNTSNVE